MEGKWLVKKTKHTRMTLYLSNQKFGSVIYTENLNDALKGVGKDLLNEKVDKEEFITTFRNSRREHVPICILLLNQSLYSGVGNYVGAEALYKARIHPYAIPKNLSDDNLTTLLKCCKKVLRKAYRKHGMTIKSFKSVTEKKGGYIPRVYGVKINIFIMKNLEEE